MTGDRASFGIVGGGWRALFFLRAARALHERFHVAGMTVRDAAKGQALEAEWVVPTYRTTGELVERHHPDFVVVSVPRVVAPGYVLELAAAGIPVLLETPPGPDLAALLDLYAGLPPRARVQVAEQYQYQPMHSARIALARSGLLGPVRFVELSVCHDYHAMSLVRLLLGLGFENATIRAQRFTHRLLTPPDRAGWPDGDGSVEKAQVVATLDFGDRLALYDFTADAQYRSPILQHRVVVRGERGEVINDDFVHLRDARTPLYDTLRRRDTGRYGNMDGFFLVDVMGAGQQLYRNPFAPARLSDDELAVATCLARMQEHVRGGPGFYGLAEAMQDHYLSLCVRQAAEQGRTVTTATQPWAGADPRREP